MSSMLRWNALSISWVRVLMALLDVCRRDTMIAEYDVRTKTDSIRRHRKTILDDTLSGGFDKPEIKKCLACMLIGRE
jgi:hypothetical protein